MPPLNESSQINMGLVLSWSAVYSNITLIRTTFIFTCLELSGSDLMYVFLCLCQEPGNLTPVRDSPAIPRLRSVNSYTNIRAATTARNLNKSLQNLNLNEEGRRESAWEWSEKENKADGREINKMKQKFR